MSAPLVGNVPADQPEAEPTVLAVYAKLGAVPAVNVNTSSSTVAVNIVPALQLVISSQAVLVIVNAGNVPTAVIELTVVVFKATSAVLDVAPVGVVTV